MRFPFLLLAGIGSAALCFAASSYAVTMSVNPIADTFLTAGSATPGAGGPTLNYGGAAALQISGTGGTKGEIQTLMRFDLASVKSAFDVQFGAGNWFVTGITLQLGTNFGTQGAQPNSSIFNTINTGLFKIDWLVNDTWGEGSGTPLSPFNPSNAPVDGATFSSLASLTSALDKTVGTFTYTPVGNTNPPSTPPASYALTLDSGFVTDIQSGNNVSLRAYAGDTGVSYLFNSRSFLTATSWPLLVIDVVPEPGTLSILGATAFLSLCRRSRRRSRGLADSWLR